MAKSPPQDHKDGKGEKEKYGYPDDSKGDPMEVDDDFLLVPDADDFGSDYESAADDILATTEQDPFKDPSNNPPISSGASFQADRAFALALGASEISPALGEDSFQDPLQHPSNNPPISSRASFQADRAFALALGASEISPALGDSFQDPLQHPKSFNGTSSASAQAARYAASLHSSASNRNGPPPTYSAVVLDAQKSLGRTSSSPMCVICNIRPAFNNGVRSFPTCGTTCGNVLQASTNLPNPIHGQMGNPYRNGSSARHPFANSNYGQSQQDQSYRSQGPIKMCQVCGLRPRFQKGGKIYPTCGLTCAAKLHPPGSVAKCDFCKERPKVIINGTTFPHCGRTCRDKAKAAEAAAASSATCKTCLICWKANRISKEDEFCSVLCKNVAETRAPFLIEIPRGHASFKTVSEHYMREWKDTRKKCPSIKRIYMVQLKPTFQSTYEKYKTRVSSLIGIRRNGNEARHWIGLTRECGLGDTGTVEPCSSAKCLLCNIVKTCVTRTNFPKGIVTTSNLDRAMEKSSQSIKGRANLVLLAQVLLGNQSDKSVTELMPPMPPHGSDSVRLIEYRTFGGKTDYHGEHIIFEGDAIKPLYLISCE